jgi:hypothetical protein
MRTNVLVFKTSISKKNHIEKVKPLLNQLMDKNGYWNFDLEDCDNILRVVTKTLASTAICNVLINQGFLCEELH